jgi:hypothetical protein
MHHGVPGPGDKAFIEHKGNQGFPLHLIADRLKLQEALNVSAVALPAIHGGCHKQLNFLFFVAHFYPFG